MVRTDSGPGAGSVVAILAVAGLGLAIVKVGQEAPPAPAAAPATAAVFEPKKLVVATSRHWPFGDWSVDRSVRILSPNSNKTKADARSPGGQLVSGGGHEVTAEVRDLAADGDRQLSGTLHINDISAGEYSGTVSLDPTAEKAAAAEVVLKARHGFHLPLVILMLGMLAGVGGTWAYESRRRRDVLRIALVDAGNWLQFVAKPKGLYDLQSELVGSDPNANLFPSARECRDGPPTLGIPRLYCGVRRALSSEQLDDRTKQVQTMLARIDRWYRAGQAVISLRKAIAKLVDPDLSDVRREAEEFARTFEKEPVGEDAELAVVRVKAESEVLDSLAETWRLYEAAGNPTGLSPLDAYTKAGSPVERTPEQSRALVLRLRALQMKLTSQSLPFRTFAVQDCGAPGGSLGTDQATPAEAEAQVGEPPWVMEEGGGYLLSERIRRNVRYWDFFVFSAHAAVAAIAFLLPVWVAAPFGSLDQYVAVFAAGFLGKIALDQALGPFRPVRLAPPGETAPPAATAKPAAATP